MDASVLSQKKLLERIQPAVDCSNKEEMKHSKQMLGKVVTIHHIPERNQVRAQCRDITTLSDLSP